MRCQKCGNKKQGEIERLPLYRRDKSVERWVTQCKDREACYLRFKAAQEAKWTGD